MHRLAPLPVTPPIRVDGWSLDDSDDAQASMSTKSSPGPSPNRARRVLLLQLEAPPAPATPSSGTPLASRKLSSGETADSFAVSPERGRARRLRPRQLVPLSLAGEDDTNSTDHLGGEPDDEDLPALPAELSAISGSPRTESPASRMARLRLERARGRMHPADVKAARQWGMSAKHGTPPYPSSWRRDEANADAAAGPVQSAPGVHSPNDPTDPGTLPHRPALVPSPPRGRRSRPVEVAREVERSSSVTPSFATLVTAAPQRVAYSPHVDQLAEERANEGVGLADGRDDDTGSYDETTLIDETCLLRLHSEARASARLPTGSDDTPNSFRVARPTPIRPQSRGGGSRRPQSALAHSGQTLPGAQNAKPPTGSIAVDVESSELAALDFAALFAPASHASAH